MTDSIDTDEPMDLLLARQPVFNKSQDVVAYLLLYRNDDNSLTINDHLATSSVILNTYTSICQHGQVRSLPCYLKLTDTTLMAENFPELPKENFILEILGHSEITPALIERVKELGEQGYRLALSEYRLEPKFEPLLNLVHILKLDVQSIGLDTLPSIVKHLRPYNLELLADKVETKEEFRQCYELGFALFQGYFLSKPEPVKGKKLGSSKVLLLQMMVELQSPQATAQSVEQIVINDPLLTYRILRVVNSAAFNFPREIESLSHAISLLGFDQIRKWVSLFLVTDTQEKPEELTRSMLVRGRMCELLAEMLGREQPINNFIAGLFSKLDALLDMEMPDLLTQVSLQNDVKAALLNHEGQLGQILEQVCQYESGEFDKMTFLLDKAYYETAYRHSLNWSQQVMASLSDK
ncbi:MULTISPECIES: EAL and HDOD domain-containing protein [unclassified Neptuniibacter]|jgi:EAL and modified HD-GYP domain-containing signal transduction protein|uniref:EAL and HDOD domain-containing protein n=1 Tax=unclassified Neptuniibacter TaxID=2630693 RepID=UPI0026E3591F|nr:MULTISPECIES: HDOD domain-containing protein [unclassified Neptuniibacter]MDO6514977.1 HDOD domain-containing protein [Neptuniibacter sp. 2_MG-2023]MDO6594264.1 HDOD domain-containing protein [Neptuniibacter sp. 1_MG-2023]